MISIPSAARRLPSLLRPLPLLLALAARPALAAEVAREVLPAASGPQRLELDAAAVSASARGDLGDLRLSDAAGRELPYLLVPPAAPAGRWAQARLLSTPATRKESGFEADLGAVLPVEQLRVEGLPEPFLKRFRLEGSGDRVRWTTLVEQGTLFALPAEALRLLSVDFTRGDYRYLRLSWDDRMSARPPPPVRVAAFVPERSPPSPAALRVPLAVERRPSEPGVSRFSLRLPGPRLPVRAVVLDVPGDRLLRRAAVLEARLGDAARLAPVRLGEATLRRVTRDGAPAEALRIPVSRPEELELELEVDDGDSGPLALAGAVAELEPLPWLYLEAAGPAPLTLRSGDPARTSPRYDLEAIRPGLAEVRPAAARLGAATAPPAPPAAPPLEAGGAPLDLSAFRWSREVAAAAPGLAAIRLDLPVIARTRGLADLRLAGPDGRQVPYLLEAREEPLVVPLPAPAPAGLTSPRRGLTRLVLPLPEPALPASRLILTTSSRLFERQVRVLEERPESEGGPRLVAEGTWRHAAPERPAAPLTLTLPAVTGARLFLELDDGDNAPLPIASAALLLPGWRLRFLHPGAPLRLLHGAEGVEAPRYDLALLAPRLRSAPAVEVALGAAPPPASPSRLRPAALAWGALVVGVLAMLWLLAKLVRR